jgi:hypothetical protein
MLTSKVSRCGPFHIPTTGLQRNSASPPRAVSQRSRWPSPDRIQRNFPKVRFSATVGEEPEIEVALAY